MRFHKTPKKIRRVFNLPRMDWVIFYISVDISCCMDLEDLPIKKLWPWNSAGEWVNPSIINISFYSLKTFFPHENLRHRVNEHNMKFSIKEFFSKCVQIRRKLRIWSHLLKNSLMGNLIFFAVSNATKFIFKSPSYKDSWLSGPCL